MPPLLYGEAKAGRRRRKSGQVQEKIRSAIMILQGEQRRLFLFCRLYLFSFVVPVACSAKRMRGNVFERIVLQKIRAIGIMIVELFTGRQI